ncbi:MAG: DUF167 domain-containing protein [Coriobacteriia bacterium]|nr:DUF167 domain-containing protein [Coriobacteriia bacterium]
MRIKVKPRAGRNEVVPAAALDELMLVTVTAAAEGGKANAAVCRALAKWAGAPKSSVSIVRGQTAPVKTVEFATLDELPEP